MKRLAKYLKPFLGLLFASVVLLFVQAICELNLPNFMSNIVNIGIQQNGIESPVPEVLDEQGMQLVTIFMDEQDRQLLEESYERLQTADLDEQELMELHQKLPSISEGSIYVLRNEKDTESEDLQQIFSKASWALVEELKTLGNSQQSSAQESSGAQASLDIEQLYQLIPQFQQISQSEIDRLTQTADELPLSTLSSYGVSLTKAFYQEFGADLGSIRTSYIVWTGLKMLGLTLLSVAATVMVTFCASRLAAGVARDLRKAVFCKVEGFSNHEFDQFSTSSLITRTTNDITQIQTVLMMGIRMICYAPIMGIGGIFMALSKSTSMGWVIALAVVLLLGLIMVVYALAMPKFKIVQRLIDKLNLVTRENLSGLMVIRAFRTQHFEEQRFDKVNKDLTSTNLFINRVMAFMMPAMMLIMNGISLLVVWVGAGQIAASAMQVGDMMAFIQYTNQIIFAFLMISMMFILIPRASVSANRIADVLEIEPTIVDPVQPKAFDKVEGRVCFDHVNFAYGDAEENVLHDISFTALPGQTTAIIGATGSGKSTLVNLIPRFYDVTSGQVTIDGVDVRQVTQHDLREKIGYVPQKGVLFSGTIASNLRYGDAAASLEALEDAADTAQATEFISEKAEEFNSPISQGGANVSGGQKQRLSIARALVKKAPIYIFDDSFSALDFKTDAALRKALKEKMGQSTVIIVAQRISTIRYAEQIIVLDEGRIVGIGTHDELMKNCETYREIASSQLSKEELA